MASATYHEIMSILRSRAYVSEILPCMAAVATCTKELMASSCAYWPEAHFVPQLMATLSAQAHKQSGLDSVNLPFDMHVEAEAFGSEVDLSSKTAWPTVHKFAADSLRNLSIPADPDLRMRVPVVKAAIRLVRQQIHESVPVVAFMNPPFTCLSNYLVNPVKFFLTLRREPEVVATVLENVCEAELVIARAYEEAGADIITLHEMAATMVSPEMFRSFIKPQLLRLVRGVKIPIIIHVCGSAISLVKDVVECSPSAISVDEKTPILQLKRQVNSHARVIGNVSPVEVLLLGTTETIAARVEECAEQGVDILAPGCDLHLETPTSQLRTLVDSARRWRRSRHL